MERSSLVSTSPQIEAGQTGVPAAPATHVRWNVVVLLGLLSVLTYMDRLNLGIVAKNVVEEFHFTEQTMGWVLGAFSLGYAWFHIPGGWLADKFGPRRVLSGAIIWYSAFTALTVVAPNLPLLNFAGAAWALVIARFLLGVGESAAIPVGNKMMGMWLGPHERALGTSIFLAGVGVAGIVSPLLVTHLALDFGWRSPFLSVGLVGILAGIGFYYYLTDRPEENPRVNAAELAIIRGGVAAGAGAGASGTSPRSRVPWGRIFSTPSMWALMLSHFCLVYPLYIFFTWFFVYMVKVRGVTVSKAGFWGTAPFLANVILVPLWGFLSDRAVRKLGKKEGRRIIVWVGVAGSAALLWAGSHTANNTIALTQLALAAGFNFAASAILYTTCTDISTKSSGSVSGIMATLGSMGGAASPVVTVYIAGHFGWARAIDFAAMVTLVSGVAWFFIDAGRQIE